MVSGLLIPSSLSSVSPSLVQLFGMNPEFLSDDVVLESYMSFFDQVYGMASLDSGLKRQEKTCNFCEIIQAITNNQYMATSPSDIALTKDNSLFPDFIIKPDHCPVSELHLLLVSQFHITSFYDFLRHSDAVEETERLVERIKKVINQLYKREIIVFEHGSVTAQAELSGSSVEHFHLHVIYKPENFNYDDFISQDNAKKDSVINTNDKFYHIKFDSISQFKESNQVKGKDYFLIWDPQQNSIIVYFPRKKESQYLRRIFYSALSENDKKRFYPHYRDNGCDDYYDWKKYDDNPFNFTDDIKQLYHEVGDAIDNAE